MTAFNTTFNNAVNTPSQQLQKEMILELNIKDIKANLDKLPSQITNLKELENELELQQFGMFLGFSNYEINSKQGGEEDQIQFTMSQKQKSVLQSPNPSKIRQIETQKYHSNQKLSQSSSHKPQQKFSFILPNKSTIYSQKDIFEVPELKISAPKYLCSLFQDIQNPKTLSVV